MDNRQENIDDKQARMLLSAIVKGIASLLCDFYSNEKPDDIQKTDADFLSEVGITQHLSPNRRNGLSRIVESIQRFAKSCLAEL